MYLFVSLPDQESAWDCGMSEVHCLETVHGAVSPLTAFKLPPGPADDDHGDDDHGDDDHGQKVMMT